MLGSSGVQGSVKEEVPMGHPPANRKVDHLYDFVMLAEWHPHHLIAWKAACPLIAVQYAELAVQMGRKVVAC